MFGSQAIVVYKPTKGIGYGTGLISSYSPADWDPWTLTLIGQPVAKLLPRAQMLLQFELRWPWPPRQDVFIFIGAGPYSPASGSGLGGMEQHYTYPNLYTMSLAKAMLPVVG
ncbi:hypothetical protein ABPG75_001048 [Micractinium tetrahymenae]